jgi:hypothetical protein
VNTIEELLERKSFNRHCGLVVRVPGSRARGLRSIPGAIKFSEKQFVWNEVHSSLVSKIEELLERKSSGSGQESRD